jgi:hypothetical protein
LSSSETEYVVMSEVIKEIRFIYFLLKSIEIDVKLPIVLRNNNVCEIFSAKNSSSGVCTRHLGTRFHFNREHVEEESIKFVLVKSD